MADLEDIDNTAPADSLYECAVKINLIRARVDGLYTVLSDITAAEANQIENIAATTITAAQWVYVSELNQSLTTTSTVTFGTINAFTLGGKLTAGSSEIEGSSFDINGGTIDGVSLTDITMSLGSDADGDIYYRSSNKLVRLAKGTASQGLVMNSEATAPEWSTPAGGGIDNVVEDTTPQLGGELDCQAHTIGFTQQTATGDLATTIDWKLGNKFYFTFGACSPEVFTFTQPTHECNLLLVLKQDAEGSRLATWPDTVKWPAGTAPTLSTGANAVDVVSFYWDGANYHGSSLLDFSVPT